MRRLCLSRSNSEDNFVEIQSVLMALQDKLGQGSAIYYAKGCDVLGDSTAGFAEAVALAERSDVAIVVVGDKSGLTQDCSTGEFRDRTSLTLPGVQEELVKAIVATGKPVVVVFVNGRPVSSPWIAEHVPAILEAWFPGEEGSRHRRCSLWRHQSWRQVASDHRTQRRTDPALLQPQAIRRLIFPYGPYVDASNEPLFPFGFWAELYAV
ncbi:MAG: glycoside hydrolase family 3 C-terminal domain-containing protein [Caldilineaceae bacterium]